jgi:hypothetical protein
MEVKYSSETSVEFQRTTRRYIPEYSTVNTNNIFIYHFQFIINLSFDTIVWDAENIVK